MTSKQLLSKLKHDKKYTKYIDVFEKDLEVLEILKKHLSVRCIGESWLLDIICDLGETELGDNEEFNIIKEWLNDTKATKDM